MLDNQLLQRIRDAILGVTSTKYGNLDSSVYLQQIRNALTGVNDGIDGMLDDTVYLQQIRNAITGVNGGVKGMLDETVYLNQILNGIMGWSNNFKDLPSDWYLKKILGIYSGSDYYLFDMFKTPRVTGSVNGTAAEPVGGTRTVTDTNSKLSITGGKLSGATGSAVNDHYSYAQEARVLGKTLLFVVNRLSGAGGIQFGWDDTTGSTVYDSLVLAPTTPVLNIVDANTFIAGGTVSFNVTYKLALIMRSSGMFYFIIGGQEYPNWTLVWTSLTGNAAMYPAINVGAGTAVYTVDNIRIPKYRFIPVPLQSDGMSAATTDGAGNAEANGVVGSAYTNAGTWGVSGGKRSCSVLSGGIGFSYLPCSSSNVLIDAVCTRTGGVTGIVARYVDANNYLIAYLDGTNAKLDKVVAGVTTNLISAAVTYGAALILRLVLDGTSARLFYNNLAVGAAATTPAAGSLNHGLYTTNIGATFDNLIIWALGSEGQYSELDTL